MNTTYKIEKSSLTDELKKLIYQGFGRHAMATIGQDEKFDPVAFVARDQNGAFIGAIVVELFWGALHIKYVYIEDNCRGKGIATELMSQVLTYGMENRCPFAYVETMSFQALGFYQKLGFELEFTRVGYKHNTSLHYLRKNL